MSYTSKYTGEEIDNLLSLVENGGGEAPSIVIDSSLSTTSTNAVQNKVVTNAINNKVDKVSDKGLSTNDYTNEDKERTLAGGVVVSYSMNNVLSANQKGSKYGRIRQVEDLNENGYNSYGFYAILGESYDYCEVVSIVKQADWINNDAYKLYVHEVDGVNPIKVVDISLRDVIQGRIAQVSEIDALFEENSNGGGSYGSF